ncbi:pyridoxamine 5'-phosphate oxidase family protein [Pseudomonas sp. GD03944]|uniref:pyridoxamine 5'-phosphate oxidase family protein n=1 Tax=Pseudomonas sp. GD03944 TaxID=2975409 RepID=UPI00244D5561|nr:pyridoxamine 5'-phosphate oxidase family protein [Pseudomonas sp. GD03944]MDH1264894.1 pyridoxamine 5'-phosphate oxidase family protein [Pseudomonas sp. GD03944]
MTTINTLEQLDALYGQPHERSLRKELDHLSAPYQELVRAAPFVVLATAGPDGLDCSPRGDAPGFVQVLDERTLLLPDRPGNNRIDSLRNIVADPRMALLFMIPGVGESLRVNGRASISLEPELLEACAVQGKLPRSVLRISVERCYFQCSKAIVRSRLWDPEHQADRSQLPSAADMIKAVSDADFDAVSYERDLQLRIKNGLY